MLRKNFIYILFYFALALAMGVSLYFYFQLTIYNIIVFCGGGYLAICILHMMLFAKRKSANPNMLRQADAPPPQKSQMADDGQNPYPPAVPPIKEKSKTNQSMVGQLPHIIKKTTPSFVAKNTRKPINALQDIIKAAYQNELLVGGKSLVLLGHDVVSAKGRQVVGYYCQGFIEYGDGQGRDTTSVVNESPKGSVTGDIEILLLETLKIYWQKMLQGADLPYCFFPLSEQALNEKGFVNDLKSFLKSQKIANPGLTRAFNRLVFILPFTAGLYRHAESCQFLSDEGIKLAMLYTSNNTALLNPILDDDPSLLLRIGIDFYLLSYDNLQFLQEKLGYETMSKKILSLEKLRLMMLVFNIDSEKLFDNLPHGIAMVMGKMFDKHSELGRLPLKTTPIPQPTE
ncbi:MAG: hypothetical protein ACR2NY_06395 [Alphaproteobacteria bacterium]